MAKLSRLSISDCSRLTADPAADGEGSLHALPQVVARKGQMVLLAARRAHWKGFSAIRSTGPTLWMQGGTVLQAARATLRRRAYAPQGRLRHGFGGVVQTVFTEVATPALAGVIAVVVRCATGHPTLRRDGGATVPGLEAARHALDGARLSWRRGRTALFGQTTSDRRHVVDSLARHCRRGFLATSATWSGRIHRMGMMHRRDNESEHTGSSATYERAVPSGELQSADFAARDGGETTVTTRDDQALLPAHVRSLDDLYAYLGQLSEEEEMLVAQPLLSMPPTPEELELLGPSFAQRVADRVARRVREG